MTKSNLKVVKSTKDQEMDIKEKNKALDAAISQITDNFGKGSVMKLGERRAMDIESVSTGSLSLDIALGIGGVPKGRIVEVYGPKKKRKTTLEVIQSNSLLLNAQISLADSEKNYILSQFNLLKSIGLLNSEYLKIR